MSHEHVKNPIFSGLEIFKLQATFTEGVKHCHFDELTKQSEVLFV